MGSRALKVTTLAPPFARVLRPVLARLRFLRSAWRRWFLWVLLAILVLILLVTVVWLAGRHEVEQTQMAIDLDTADAAADLRDGLQRNAQTLRATLAGAAIGAGEWEARAATLLLERREWLRLEWRDAALDTRTAVDTPYQRHVFENHPRARSLRDVALACANARKLGAGAYSPSHYVPTERDGGLEVMEMCLPLDDGGYLVAAYSLRDMLTEFAAPGLSRGQEVAFTEADGTRLVSIGVRRRIGTRVFTARQAIDLPGAPLVLRVDGWRAVPDLFPDMLTALVTAISIALVSVLALLANDTRRRLHAERDLADALAFRKAMEDSLVTGLRARDLQGRITYVNPAFCEMVGFSAEELMNGDWEAPYWPTELAHEYQRRQSARLAGALPPREGFESVIMRKDGTRFPALIFEAPLINASGAQTGWMSAFIDLSEQRRIEELSRTSQERLQASARLATIGEMASLLSHELTQPLAAIAGYATGSLNLLQAQSQRGDLDGVSTAMRRIAEQADRAGQVIRSVRNFVRRRDRAREAVEPRALIDAVLPLAHLQARKLGVRVEVALADRLPLVYCDPTLVEQVLLNLARNGMQAMDMPGLVERVLRIEVAVAGATGARRWLEFCVADGGCGIGDEVAARLFTPFFTTRPDGMGLGLSLCRTVVEQHGGALVFEPRSPRGTVFRFTLPAA
jgi:two-component system sensor histidine kinase DctS